MMLRLIFLFLCPAFLLLFPAEVKAVASSNSPKIEALLEELDSLLVASPQINQAKEMRLASLRAAYGRKSDNEHRYWMASALYDEYAAYDSDSAMAYADRAKEIAVAMGRPDLVADMELNRAYVFSATGLLDEAVRSMASIDESKLSQEQMLKYCDRMLFLSLHRDQYMGDSGRDTAYPASVDSLITLSLKSLTVDDRYYCWIVGWGHLKNKAQAEAGIEAVRPIVDGSEFKTREDALNAYVLSKLYEYAGDEEMKLKYLILSAQADVRASVKEMASLEEVAAILYENGDLERSNNYVNYCISCANQYKSRVRLGPLASLQERALGAIYKHSQMQASENRRMLVFVVAALVVLVLALVFIIRQMRQLSKSRVALSHANNELHEHIDELQQTREELREANERLAGMYDSARQSASDLSANNEAKERYIANIFAICSDYINKLDDFRKNIYRMIAARRYDEVRELTKSPELSHVEIKELYANFDRIFLQIYPDFVEDFNTLLRPEERIELRNDGHLTTELRIYALVRLGLNDSVKIAKFLHMSVQTVYNTRQRARNKAAVPKETFAEAVKSLGKPSF